MTEIDIALLKAFPEGKMNRLGEFIGDKKGIAYFNLFNCVDNDEVCCKVLEWFSRAAYKAEPYQTARLNDKLHEYYRKGINTFLETDFTHDDIEIIYQYLGNGCNRDLCETFVESGYDMDVLRT